MPRKTERRHVQGDETRQRILEATLEIAAERGYDGTTVSLVTERTGMPASSVYWHFTNKDELLAETLEYSYQLWRESSHTWESVDPDADASHNIADQILKAGKSLVDRPEFWRLGLMLALDRRIIEPAAKRRFLEVRANSIALITAWWHDALPAALASDIEFARRMARLQVAVMDGLFVGAQVSPHWDVPVLLKMLGNGLGALVETRLEEIA